MLTVLQEREFHQQREAGWSGRAGGMDVRSSGRTPRAGSATPRAGELPALARSSTAERDEGEAPPGSHPDKMCDMSGQDPIVGWRYNKRGADYDLCEAMWLTLPAHEQALYDRIPPPASALEAAGPAGAQCRLEASCTFASVMRRAAES